MIKGAFVFAAGLAVGTVYGVGYGLRLSKAILKVAEETSKKSGDITVNVPGQVVNEKETVNA